MSQNFADGVYLHELGWRMTGITEHPGKGQHWRITWWRKRGREYPQHFALWLERTGAVKLIEAKA